MTNRYCKSCANYLGNLSCIAFDKIPEAIMLGEIDHSEPIKGQYNDVVYEPKEGN